MGRKQAEAFILTYIEKLAPGGFNAGLYKEQFKKMSDKDFETFIGDLETGKKFLYVIVPNFNKSAKLSLENNLKIAEELGHNFFQKLWIEGQDDMPDYQTPIEYLVVDLPLRRASQTLVKKISVPDNQKVINALTAQPTGDSKGAKISYTELQVLTAMGMEKSLVELMKFRGGDVKGHAAMNTMLSRFGNAKLDVLEPYTSGVESTKSLKTFLTSAHLKSTL